MRVLGGNAALRHIGGWGFNTHWTYPHRSHQGFAESGKREALGCTSFRASAGSIPRQNFQYSTRRPILGNVKSTPTGFVRATTDFSTPVSVISFVSSSEISCWRTSGESSSTAQNPGSLHRRMHLCESVRRAIKHENAVCICTTDLVRYRLRFRQTLEFDRHGHSRVRNGGSRSLVGYADKMSGPFRASAGLEGYVRRAGWSGRGPLGIL